MLTKFPYIFFFKFEISKCQEISFVGTVTGIFRKKNFVEKQLLGGAAF